MSTALRWKTSSHQATEYLNDYTYVLTAVDDHMTGKNLRKQR